MGTRKKKESKVFNSHRTLKISNRLFLPRSFGIFVRKVTVLIILCFRIELHIHPVGIKMYILHCIICKIVMSTSNVSSTLVLFCTIQLKITQQTRFFFSLSLFLTFCVSLSLSFYFSFSLSLESSLSPSLSLSLALSRKHFFLFLSCSFLFLGLLFDSKN